MWDYYWFFYILKGILVYVIIGFLKLHYHRLFMAILLAIGVYFISGYEWLFY
jgi:hypothetical protein